MSQSLEMKLDFSFQVGGLFMIFHKSITYAWIFLFVFIDLFSNIKFNRWTEPPFLEIQ